jgi:hypothetical protein
MKKIFMPIALCCVLALTACTDADRAQIGGFGGTFKITLYGANGTPIREWISEGKVSTEDHSDGWYFNDATTNKLVRISGTVIVEQIK